MAGKMIRAKVIASLCELAVSLGPAASGTEWHLFGSVNRGDSDASDIDLMIFCKNDTQADILRQAIDVDSLLLPLHLSLLTFKEAVAINAAFVQQSTVILRLNVASMEISTE
jgi:predicted nucleotidyltransferase